MGEDIVATELVLPEGRTLSPVDLGAVEGGQVPADDPHAALAGLVEGGDELQRGDAEGIGEDEDGGGVGGGADAAAGHGNCADEGQIVEIVASIALFGYLNRWNDTMATELEPLAVEVAERTIGPVGWEPGKHG